MKSFHSKEVRTEVKYGTVKTKVKSSSALPPAGPCTGDRALSGRRGPARGGAGTPRPSCPGRDNDTHNHKRCINSVFIQLSDKAFTIFRNSIHRGRG